MRIRLTPAVTKLVEKNRKVLSASSEVNRALEDYYNRASVPTQTITTDALQKLLGSHTARRFLRSE